MKGRPQDPDFFVRVTVGYRRLLWVTVWLPDGYWKASAKVEMIADAGHRGDAVFLVLLTPTRSYRVLQTPTATGSSKVQSRDWPRKGAKKHESFEPRRDANYRWQAAPRPPQGPEVKIGQNRSKPRELAPTPTLPARPVCNRLCFSPRLRPQVPRTDFGFPSLPRYGCPKQSTAARNEIWEILLG